MEKGVFLADQVKLTIEVEMTQKDAPAPAATGATYTKAKDGAKTTADAKPAAPAK